MKIEQKIIFPTEMENIVYLQEDLPELGIITAYSGEEFIGIVIYYNRTYRIISMSNVNAIYKSTSDNFVSSMRQFNNEISSFNIKLIQK